MVKDMGYMRHHMIVVTTSISHLMDEAHKKAIEIFTNNVTGEPICHVTEMTPVGVNGHRSFMVAPDGSKEGWPPSDDGDDARDAFVAWLNAQAYSDGSNSLSWAEVQFGDEDDKNMILRDPRNNVLWPEDD